MRFKSFFKNFPATENENLSFWEHLDVLRTVLLKIGVVTVVFSLIAFIFKDFLFSIILAPQNDDFVTYGFLDYVSTLCGFKESETFHVELINTAITGQFMVHIQAALAAGIVVASPYIIYELFKFVSPALYSHERRYAVGVVGCGYVMFMLGVLLCYFMVFPLTFRFLSTYHVDPTVTNMISLNSYMETLLMLSLMMGIMFEIPIIGWLFAKLGFINSTFLSRYRRHAIVIIITIAALITPTSDAVTLTVVSLPIYLLYELTIIIISHTTPHSSNS